MYLFASFLCLSRCLPSPLLTTVALEVFKVLEIVQRMDVLCTAPAMKGRKTDVNELNQTHGVSRCAQRTITKTCDHVQLCYIALYSILSEPACYITPSPQSCLYLYVLGSHQSPCHPFALPFYSIYCNLVDFLSPV